MGSLKTFLKPGWVLGVVGVIAFTYACFTLLAPWQLGKGEDLDERNRQLRDSIAAEVVSYSELAFTAQDVGSDRDSTSQQWRLVTTRGKFVPDKQVLLRNRNVDGQAAFHVLTLFTTDAGRHIVINRGFVRPLQASGAPRIEPAPSGKVSITGRIRVSEPSSDPQFEAISGQQSTSSLSTESLGKFWGVSTDHSYIQLSPDQAGALTAVPVPDIQVGPYFSYGLQWILFGVLAPIGLFLLVRSEIRQRRSEDQDQSHPQQQKVAEQSPRYDSAVRRSQQHWANKDTDRF